MSHENVELAYRAFGAVNRHDLDGYLALMDEDVEAVPLVAAMEGGYHGHEGIRRWWQSLHDGFPDFTVEVVELRDLGDLTVAHLRGRGHGAGSDTPFEQTIWLLVEGHHEKVVSWSAHRTEAEVLKAVRLRK